MTRFCFIAPLLAAAVALGVVARAQDRADPSALAGTWEGRATFAAGWQARVSVTLAEAGPRRATGRYELVLLDEEGAGTPSTGQARLTWDEAGDAARLELVEAGRTLEVRGRIGPAASHAERCFYGSFTGADATESGVFILWRYRR